MSRLFITPYLDENVDVRLAAVVRGRGFEATTTQEAGQLGKSDEDQLAYAATLGMAIVTHNRAHFEQLAAQYLKTGRSHAGIIVATSRAYYNNARRLLKLLNELTADEMANQLLYI